MTPSGLSLSGNTLSWTAVPAAATYYVSDGTIELSTASNAGIDISSLSSGPITVIAEDAI